MMSGQPPDCYGGYMNGVWDYQNNTADGKRVYKMRVEQYGSTSRFVYFDKASQK